MSTVTLRPQLMEQVERVAAEQAMMPDELLEEALHTYLRQIERDKIKAEPEAFRSMHAELVERYPRKYVAICNGQVVDHDDDFQTLPHRIRQRFGR